MKSRVIAIVLLALSARAEAMDLRFGGSGSYVIDRSVPCLTPEERADIQARLAASRSDLQARGLLSSGLTPQTVLFGWPLKLLVGNDPGYHGIWNFVDENPAYPNQVLDYDCGSRTYDDASGYNHQGTDFFLWPFAWYKMDHDQVAVVAAADGVILAKDDDSADRSCRLSSGDGPWNAVYVKDRDGSEVWYGHLKRGSLTSKASGDTVKQGEFLGIVGSSGSSTGPHLHFEVYDASGHLIDPWGGPCNHLGGRSWWASQRPYYDSAINALYTHDAAPEFPACPSEEIPHFQDTFTPGQEIIFAAYYRDQLQGQLTNFRVYDAAGNLVKIWGDSSSILWTAASYRYWYARVPYGYELGSWRFEADFQGMTVHHDFSVVSPSAAANPSSQLEMTLLGSQPSAGQVALEIQLPAAGVARLSVYDARGRRVTSLLDGWQPAGSRQVTWKPGTSMPPGVYVARLEAAVGSISHTLYFVR